MLQIFTDPRCLRHRSPPGMPERADRLEEVVRKLEAGPWPMVHSVEVDGAEAAVAAVHDPRYVARLRSAVERGDGLIDSADNPLSPGTWEAALAAVEVALAAADWMMAEPEEGGLDSRRSAFAAVRPPGHHAERGVAMGFCYFNNVAVAAEHLLRRHGLERVAILDFDVHHGNGTQHLFEERSDVVFLSSHQFPFYPGTGAATETGLGAGAGATVNVPLAAGTGDDGYRQAFDDVLLPALREAAPEALLISAGFDAWQGDPLGGMTVTADGFEAWGRWLGALAAEHCQGRCLSVLEGGYDLRHLGELVQRYLQGLENGLGA